jgi:hypothetical protein
MGLAREPPVGEGDRRIDEALIEMHVVPLSDGFKAIRLLLFQNTCEIGHLRSP